MAVGLRVVECEKIAAESCTSRVCRRSGLLTTVASRICDPQYTAHCEQFPSQCGGPPPPPVITSASVRLMFASTLSGGTLLPLRRVTVSWAGPSLVSSSSLTDDDGYVNVPCNASQNGSVSLTTNLNNPTDLWISELVTNTAFNLTLTSQCTATAAFIWGWAEASVWEYTLRSVLGVRSVFAFSRPRVEVAYTGRFNPMVSVYRRTSDFIAFHPNDVNGTRGIFVASHEFGHAVHAKLPNGIPPGNCPTPHRLEDPSNATCAFVEGFANFISAASSPTGNDFAVRTEADFFRPQCVQPATCEAIFAATLFDLIDPTSNGDPDGFPDSVELPARHVLDVFGSCVMYFDLRSFPSGGIVNSWSSRSTQTSDLRRCLLNESPALVGPIDATTDLWFVNRVLPWPTLTGVAFTNVLARITR